MAGLFSFRVELCLGGGRISRGNAFGNAAVAVAELLGSDMGQ